MTRPTNTGAGLRGRTTRRLRGLAVGAGNEDRVPRGVGRVATRWVFPLISDLAVVRFPTGQSSHPGVPEFEWARGLFQPRTNCANSVQ
jgi:hypothetical protein